MGYQPSVSVNKCPACHSIYGGPKLKTKGVFRQFVRLECKCGVAGAWQLWTDQINNWNLAARGWELVAGEPAMPAPPPKSR
jgi:hypothetical protein